jgi:diguanylate cyclase (GGDEF)-like protein
MTIAEYKDWLRASLRAANVAGLILITACWAIAAYVSSVEHDKAVEEKLRQTEDMLRLFEQSTTEVLDRIDRTLLLLRNSYEEDPGRFDLDSWAARIALLVDETFQITLIDVHGFQLASTTGYSGPPPFLGNNDYFREPLAFSDDRLFIGEPALGPASDKLSLQFSRRLRAPDGGFGGVIVASIDPNFIGKAFRAISSGQTGSIILRDIHGVVLAAQGVPSSNIGRQITPRTYLEALARSASGYYWGRSNVDDDRRLMAFRRTEKFPLVFAVGLADSDGLGENHAFHTKYLGAAAILTLMILAAMAVNTRRQRILDDSQARLRRLNEEIYSQNLRFDAAIANLSNGISMFDGDGKLMLWNQRYIDIYEFPPDLIRHGVGFESVLAFRQAANDFDRDVNSFIADFRAQLIKNRQAAFCFQLGDGRVVSVVNTAIASGGWVSIHEDITERKRAEAEIAHMARHDALTGLANRAAFNARLAEATDRAARQGGAVALLMLDLDKFKAVNDTLGHPAGDQLLVEVGQRLRSALRDGDVLARLGGDEFAIIQEGGSDQYDAAIRIAKRIIQAIGQPFDLNGHPTHVGSSLGIALAPQHGVDPEALLTAADLALYDAKASGRNDYRVFQAAMREAARNRKLAESELQAAIERHEFELHYQPVVDVKRHLLCGVEALVRWRHPTRGLLAPDQFIPLAESTGLIVALGEWILQQACSDAISLPEHIKVAVNVSAVQFCKGELFNALLRMLATTGLRSDRIELEITETTHLESQEPHLAIMRKLKDIGISMVLDDFGTGYSSLNYLISFPFDKIKIDKSFIRGALDRSDCAAVIASTLALTQELGIMTTAEGVETEQQFEHMRKLGIDLVQGHLFGRPAPISEFGPQMARTLEVLCNIEKPTRDPALRTRDGSKMRA